jgi:hypothetical protein
MRMSEIAGAVFEPFWSAELDYRREQAARSFGGGGRRRFRIRRRPALKLPQQGARRPVAVA